VRLPQADGDALQMAVLDLSLVVGDLVNTREASRKASK
jgi:hypothetical protein